MPKILLVEDNELNRDMLSRRLERRGYTVVMACDGAEGVTRAQADAPDLILMDMSLRVVACPCRCAGSRANPAGCGQRAADGSTGDDASGQRAEHRRPGFQAARHCRRRGVVD